MSTNKLQLDLAKALKNKNQFFNFVEILILEDNHTSLLDMAQGHFFKQLEVIYGQEFMNILNKIWIDTLKYTYETDPLKPAFRDPENIVLYIKIAVSKLWNLLKFWKHDFSITDLILSTETPKGYTIEDIVAYGIDNKPDEVLPVLSEIIEESTSFIKEDIIRGIIKSSNSSLQLKLFNLLLKKNVDSQLKKSILVNGDCGDTYSFKSLIDFIAKEELYSLGEVIDSVYNWSCVKSTSLYSEEIKLIIGIMNDVLGGQNRKMDFYLRGNESEYIYFSLWAEGLQSFSSMKEKIFLLNKSKNAIENLNALYFLHLFCNEKERMEAALFRMKKRIDPLYAYYVIQNYIIHVTYPKPPRNYKYTITEERVGVILDKDFFPKDSATLNEHFDTFYKIALYISEYSFSYEKPFCWSDYIKDSKTIFFKLFDITAYAGFPEEKIDRLCDIVMYSPDEIWVFFILHFVKEGRTKRQRDFIFYSLKEGSSLLKERMSLIIKRSEDTFTSQEKEILINLFDSSVTQTHRKLITSHILGFQKNLMMEIVSEIILAKKDPIKKEAAEIFLKHLRNDREFPVFFEKYKMKKEENNLKKKKNRINKPETAKEKKYFQNFAKKNGSGTSNISKFTFLFDVEEMLFSEISSIKSFFNLDIKKLEEKIESSTVNSFLEELPLNNLLEIDLALTLEKFFDLEAKEEDKTHSDFSLFILNNFDKEKMRQIYLLAKKKKNYLQKISDTIKSLYPKFDTKEIFNMKINIINSFTKTLTEEAYYNIEIIHFMRNLFNFVSDEELENTNNFKSFFAAYYVFYHRSDLYESKRLKITHFLRALDLKLITEDEVYKELLERGNSFTTLSDFFNLDPEEREKYSFDPEAESKIVSTIVKLETDKKNDHKRSEFTYLIPAVKKVVGISALFSILEAMNRNKIDIVPTFSFKTLSKRETLNYLLFASQPAEEESTEGIRKLTLLLDNPYSLKKALLFVGVHIPKWRKLLSEYLYYPYLDEVCWFFKAHLGFEKNLKNRVEILKYTSINPEELAKGRFDIKWFKKLYILVGELEFEQICDSFKKCSPKSEVTERFITYFSNIFDFKDIEPLEEEIRKENKKSLFYYSLLPYEKVSGNTPLENIYDTIRYFFKPEDLLTKSQLETINIVLNNFLDNIGFSSRVFFELNLDMEHQPLLRNFLKDDNITAAYITTTPNNKLILKKYASEEPNSLQREKYIMKAYETVRNYNILIKDLMEYFKICMNLRKKLVISEIFYASKNPLTSLFTRNIIFEIDKHNFGFPRGDSFITVDGEIIPVSKKSTKVKIAHPMEMPSVVLEKFKTYFKENNIVQEFKQLELETYIFRNKKNYKKELINFLDRNIDYNLLQEFLLNHGWEKFDENTFIKPYSEDNLVIQFEIQYVVSTSSKKKNAFISSIIFLNIQENEPELFSKIPNRILSDILYDLNHIFAHNNNQN